MLAAVGNLFVFPTGIIASLPMAIVRLRIEFYTYIRVRFLSRVGSRFTIDGSVLEVRKDVCARPGVACRGHVRVCATFMAGKKLP